MTCPPWRREQMRAAAWRRSTKQQQRQLCACAAAAGCRGCPAAGVVMQQVLYWS
jgi:hypothetical protein